MPAVVGEVVKCQQVVIRREVVQRVEGDGVRQAADWERDAALDSVSLPGPHRLGHVVHCDPEVDAVLRDEPDGGAHGDPGHLAERRARRAQGQT
jgi:hypothetical protein